MNSLLSNSFVLAESQVKSFSRPTQDAAAPAGDTTEDRVQRGIQHLVRRIDRCTLAYDIKSTVTKIASPLGGGIYIDVPLNANAGAIGYLNAMANLKIAEGVANGKVQTIVVPYDFKGIVNAK